MNLLTDAEIIDLENTGTDGGHMSSNQTYTGAELQAYQAGHDSALAQFLAVGGALNWPNKCNVTVPSALRYLANNERPMGGESRFNSWHLYQLVDELEAAIKHVQDYSARSAAARYLAETALLKVLDAVQQYLPPDGIDAKEALNRIIAVVDPWPLGSMPDAIRAQEQKQ